MQEQISCEERKEYMASVMKVQARSKKFVLQGEEG